METLLISIESGEMLDPQPLSFSEDVLILTTTLLGEMMIITSITIGSAKHDQFSIDYSSAHRCFYASGIKFSVQGIAYRSI
jgi:hypothetical protein